MAIDLLFSALHGDEPLDLDHAGLDAFLAAHDLALTGTPEAPERCLVRRDGRPVMIGQAIVGITISPDGQGRWSGAWMHAHLNADTAVLAYDFAVATRTVILNPQGPPLFIVAGHSHGPDDLPSGSEGENSVWVDCGAALLSAVDGA